MLILASKSAVRKTLLDNAGLQSVVRSAPVDERAIEDAFLREGGSREGLAQRLAEAKALAVSQDAPEALVIGADQTLVFDDRTLHKPVSLDEARERLEAMAGKSHHLHSGVALARGGTVLWSAVDSAVLTLKPFSRDRLETVIALEGAALLQSVGGYRLEGPSVRLFEAIKGDYFTILGLPLLALLAALETHAPELLDASP